MAWSKTGSYDPTADAVFPEEGTVLAPASGGPTSYGIAGSTMVGTATLPAASSVWHTAPAFGVGGNSRTPSKVGSSIPNLAARNVAKDVVIDDVKGTLEVDLVSMDYVF